MPAASNRVLPDVSLHFVTTRTPVTSARLDEIECANAKSHAARVAHSRKQRLKQRWQKESDKVAETRMVVSGNSDSSRYQRNAQTYFPLQELLHGNSDPFDSFFTPLTPEVSRVMEFAQQHFLKTGYMPRQFRTAVRRKRSRYSRPRAELDVQAGIIDTRLKIALVNRSTALAFIACQATALSRHLDHADDYDLKTTTIRIKGEAISALRDSVASADLSQSSNLLLGLQIANLFQCECIDRNRHAAQVHAHLLQRILSQAPISRQTMGLIGVMMYGDLELATSLLQPTVVKPRYWYRSHLKPFWKQTGLEIPALPPSMPPIHPHITNPEIRAAIHRMRQGLNACNGFLPSNTPPSFVPYLWWSCSSLDDGGVMLNLALAFPPPTIQPDSSHPLPRQGQRPSDNSNSEGELQTRLTAALAFTTFCTIRKYMRDGTVDNPEHDVQDFSHLLAPRLRAYIEALLLQRILMTSQDQEGLPQQEEEEQGFKEVLFWMLFTGALYEQTVCRHQLALDQDDGESWFSGALGELAKDLGLVRWEDARMLVQRFVFLEEWLDPEPEMWWEDVMTMEQG